MQVRDKQGAMFGGFAADPWSKNGTFYGSPTSFLFTLLPRYAIYFASGVNENFQWCGHRWKELPNGIGFGGQVCFLQMKVKALLLSDVARAFVAWV